MLETYRLEMGGSETAWELFFSQRYDLVGPHVHEFIATLTFSSERCENILIPVSFPDGFFPSIDDVLVAFRNQELIRPTLEHVLRFGSTYPDTQRVCPHIFPHDPWVGPDGDEHVVTLQGNVSGRRFDLSKTKYRWANGRVFMGVLRK